MEHVAGPALKAVVPAWLTWPLLAGAGLVAAGAAWGAFLLARFAYDGLYGQDAYAYYGQAQALWREVTGQAPLPDGLYSSNGLYHWPIGYHLHLMLGFLLGGPGPGGGRAITLLMTVLTPALVALLASMLWTGAPARNRVVAGLIAGGALLLSGTYMRMGLSIMADVPALFWSILAVLCGLQAWPPDPAVESAPRHRQIAWAVGAGITFGLAVLTRYGAALLLGPALLYLLLRHLTINRTLSAPKIQNPKSKIVWAALGFAVAMLPQVAYLLTHDPGPGVSEWLAGWNLSNLFARTVSSVDGTATYNQPMLVFYLIEPLRGSAAGFLSAFYLPALLLGAAVLIRERCWPVLGLLASW